MTAPEQWARFGRCPVIRAGSDDRRNTRFEVYSQESRRRDIEGIVTQPVPRGEGCPGFQEKPSNPELCWETPPLAKFQ